MGTSPTRRYTGACAVPLRTSGDSLCPAARLKFEWLTNTLAAMSVFELFRIIRGVSIKIFDR